MPQRLTQKEIKKLPIPDKGSKKYFDEKTQGLYLEVYANGKYKWRVKVVTQGEDKRVTLGDYPIMSLQQAREAATLKRKDVIESAGNRHRNLQKSLFKDVIVTWINKEEIKWSKKHTTKIKWLANTYIIPALGEKVVEEIVAPEFIEVCKKAEKCSSVYVYKFRLDLTVTPFGRALSD